MLLTTLQVTVKTVVPDTGGNDRVEAQCLWYGRDRQGREGFLDDRGVLYAGPDSFVFRVTQALQNIERGGPSGHALVSYLENASQVTNITLNYLNEADMDAGSYIFWNPSDLRGAPDEHGDTTRPSFIALAHELAHISDIWKGTICRKRWKVLPADADGEWKEVSCAELYATHIENLVRAENGVPLRMSYGISGESSSHPGQKDLSSLLVRPGTRESLYFDKDGHTRYRQLKSGETPMVY